MRGWMGRRESEGGERTLPPYSLSAAIWGASIVHLLHRFGRGGSKKIISVVLKNARKMADTTATSTTPTAATSAAATAPTGADKIRPINNTFNSLKRNRNEAAPSAVLQQQK